MVGMLISLALCIGELWLVSWIVRRQKAIAAARQVETPAKKRKLVRAYYRAR